MRSKLPSKPRSGSWLLASLAGVALCAPLCAPARAEELKMAPAADAAAGTPNRGMSMEKVEATFGAPVKRVLAVGQPPITRWEYPSFVVYFESNLVLHSVVRLEG